MHVRDEARYRAVPHERRGLCSSCAQAASRHAAGETPIVPQGGNTGLVGGQVPVAPEGREIVLSLSRLNRIREIDPVSNTVIVEAGVTLAVRTRRPTRPTGSSRCRWPSQGSCQIGGNLSSNAGGTGVLAYGNARELCLGVEVVLPTGRGSRRPAQAEEGQHRLRPEEPVRRCRRHARRHHGGRAEALPEAQGREVAFLALSSPEAALALFDAARTLPAAH
jgi:FAD/FMN-containing dehydrogenase